MKTNAFDTGLAGRKTASLWLKNWLCYCVCACILVVLPAHTQAPAPLGADNSTITGTRPVMVSLAGGNGGKQLLLTGEPGKNYLIQASPDLVRWVTIATNRADASGTVQLNDPNATAFPRRFYRAILQGTETPASLGFRGDRVLLKPKTGVILSVPDLLPGAFIQHTFRELGQLQVVQLPDGQSAQAAIASLSQNAQVAYAEPDYNLHALLEPDDFRFQDGSLWSFKNTGQLAGVPDADIDAPEAWETVTSANNVIVAVIDTGIHLTHEDLAPNLWTNPGEIPGNGLDDDNNGYVDDVHGINTLNHDGHPADDYGHGTHISGIIGGAGNNQTGVAGVCWQVQLLTCKFLDAEGNGSVSDAIKCIDYARSKGAKIINASWGNTMFTSQALQDAIQSARAAGIIFVAAAGNSQADNDIAPLYPASYDLDNIIAVAATTRTDDMADFSNYGATKVDLAAPGNPIFSCWTNADDAYQYAGGTSMAAAHVTGVCALTWALHPTENYQQIIQRIFNGVDPLPGLTGKCTTGGRLNAQKALGGTSPPPKPTVTVTASDANAAEPNNPGTFTISRTGSTSTALTVNYALSGTAGNGSDYQNLPNSLSIPSGSSSATITVTPIDDSAVEASETVILTLTANSAYDLGNPNNATVTIADNDQPPPPKPTVTVAASDANAAEPNNSGTFTISRTGSTSTALTINYALSGTAGNGSDYQNLPGSLTIPSGSSSATITVTPIDDSAVESSETVVLTLTANNAYNTGSPGNATVTIADNDQAPAARPVISVVATDATASESGDTGTFTIYRTGNTASALTVIYTLGGHAQNGVDYQSLPGSITIPAGAPSANVVVRPVDDTDVEIDEPVYLMLYGWTDAPYIVGDADNATVTITNTDQPPVRPVVTVVATDATASESGNTGTFTIYRTGSTASALTVIYTLGGHAQNGVDYQSLPGSITIPAGAPSANVVVRPQADTNQEIDEPVYLMLYGWTEAPYIVGKPDNAAVTILDIN